MPTVHTLTLGEFQTNTYIVTGNGKSCAIIDPGFEPSTILAHVKALGLTVDAILLTHGHFDHVGGVEKIVSATDCELWMSKADWTIPCTHSNRYLYPLSNNTFADIFFFGEGQRVVAGGLQFIVLATPGHTPGSVCFLCDGVLFTGDTLFAGSCGRTDLPGGDSDTLAASLKRLTLLEHPFTVYPGHGCATTLQHEKRANPFMR